MSENLLEMKNITKIYNNGFVANNNVNFSVKKGEIHGLVGENGAGKTTLMKVLFGQEICEKGNIFINGKEIKIKSPLDALNYGIGMVHQHFMLVENLSILDNMVLGNEPTRGIFYDRKKARDQVVEVSKKFDLEVNPDEIVENLSVGLKQRVEILKILLKGATLLLLDEPTAVLTPQETKELFSQLKKLRNQGYSIVFISHKLNEVKELCDRITVLRMGESVTTVDIKDVSEADISKLMVGKDISLANRNIEEKEFGEAILKVRNLSNVNENNKFTFENVSFDVRVGEIVGLAGVEGNGQSQLSDTISGLIPIQSGDVIINGTSIKNLKSIRDIRNLKASIIHEDRMTYGISTTMSIYENINADRYYKDEYSNHGFLKINKQVEDSKILANEFSTKYDSIHSPVKTLSGGNIQKVVAAREFSSNPKFLLACQPTRGIDIGAATLIREKMLELKKNENTAILLLSADLGELLSVSDSIMVIYEGKIVAYFKNGSELNETILGEYMLGLKKMSSEEMEGLYNEE